MAGLRLAIVTGKGGVGKTTVAASLARAAVADGRRALVVEIARPGRLASVLGLPSLGPEPRAVAHGLFAVALDESRALEAFVHRLLPLRLLSRRLLSSETFRILAAAVPGILDAALLARVVAWLEESDFARRPRYDLVVLDAPASGHSVPLLATPRTLSGLATIGPLGEIMRRTSRWLGDDGATAALVVAIPEEWAVAEAVELYRSLRDSLAIPLAPPLLNAAFPRRFSRHEERLLEEAECDGAVDPSLLAAGRHFVDRRRAAVEHARALKAGTGVRPVELPFVFSRTMTGEDLDPVAGALRPVLEGV